MKPPSPFTTTKHLLKLNSQLANLTRSNRELDAFQLYNLTRPHLNPDHYTLSTLLTACANARIPSFGSQLHAQAVKYGLLSYPHVANTLLSLYAKTGKLCSLKRVFEDIRFPDVYARTTLLSACVKLSDIGYAFKVFDEMPERDVAVWNAMITGFSEKGYDGVVFNMFLDMHRLGVPVDNYSFACVLSLCSSEVLDFGRQVHCLVIKTGFSSRSSVINSLISMYFGCEGICDAGRVFEAAEVHDQITYNVMIDGLASTDRVSEAFAMFSRMQEACLRPTKLTFVSLLSSCSNLRSLHQVYAQAIKEGLESCNPVGNATITMYSNCGDLQAAHVVFDRLKEKDLVSWNAMISGYSQWNRGELAISTYVAMQRSGLKPDDVTFIGLLAGIEVVEVVETINGFVYKVGLMSKVQVSNAFISAFSKLGMMKQAYQIFYTTALKNLISWNTIISGLLLNGLPWHGLEMFSDLILSGLKPNAYTLSIALSICASLCSMSHGKQIHGYILRNGFFTEVSLGNCLVALYSKCGVLDSSLKVFNEMTERDTVSWNSLISAFSQHGEGTEAVLCFEAMQNETLCKPDLASFTALLSACSHAGLVNEGIQIFSSMVTKYGFEPNEDHVSCMVDLLGRAGHLDEAERAINNQQMVTCSSSLWTLLSSCASHGNLRLGKMVAQLLLDSEEDKHTVYVLLSNIYAAAGHWDKAATVRSFLKRNGMVKQPGCSWIELGK